LWQRSRDEVADEFERSVDSPVKTIELEDLSQHVARPTVEELPNVSDAQTLREQIEGLSEVKQTMTGRGFHDEDMMSHMEPILHKLRLVPQATAIALGKRLADIMAPKWYNRHAVLTAKLIELASQISVELGVYVSGAFQKKRLVDFESIRHVRIMACPGGELGEATDLLAQLRLPRNVGSALQHVCNLLDDSAVTRSIIEKVALGVAWLSQTNLGPEAYRAVAIVAKRLDSDRVEAMGKAVLRAIRRQGVRPDPESLRALVPILLERSSVPALTRLLAEVAFPPVYLTAWSLPSPVRSALHRAFEDELGA
jgi:hypothetical protein